MNKRLMLIVSGLALVCLLASTFSLSYAQRSTPAEGVALRGSPGSALPGGPGVLAPEAPSDANDYFPIQGRLTDASGQPLNGTFTLHFHTYDVSTGGATLCSSTRTVTVVNGLFNSDYIGCGSENDGRPLYLGIAVGADPEMTPRQSIRSVPYAYSLRPGAVISGTLGSDAVLHIENWGTSGRGLRAYAMDTTSANYGVVGASRSPAGYGGYFYNSGGGVGLKAESTDTALQLTGSGRLESTADITIAVSPLNMIPKWDSIGDLEFLSDGAYLEVRPVTAGFQYVHIPVDVPATLYGTTTKLKSIRICYRSDQAGSFVSTTILSQGTDLGTLNQSINDTTSRASTSWDCYTVTDPTPDAIQGSVYLQLTMSFAGTGSAHDIRIGNIALRLTEQ